MPLAGAFSESEPTIALSLSLCLNPRYHRAIPCIRVNRGPVPEGQAAAPASPAEVSLPWPDRPSVWGKSAPGPIVARGFDPPPPSRRYAKACPNPFTACTSNAPRSPKIRGLWAAAKPPSPSIARQGGWDSPRGGGRLGLRPRGPGKRFWPAGAALSADPLRGEGGGGPPGEGGGVR